MGDFVALPVGFSAHVANVGVRDDSLDLAVVRSDRAASVAGVFTRSRFAGPSVEISRRHVADGVARGFVVVSKNANVANGPQGLTDAAELVELAAGAAGCAPSELVVASTGVIGWRYRQERFREHFGAGVAFDCDDAVQVATAMMTTDTHPKTATARVGDASVVGVAKGVGMIEPDMATMLALVMTDAEVAADDLAAVLGRVAERTFNSLSVDTDTSTSDTFCTLANGAAGPVDLDAFETALGAVCLDLTRQLAADGEGAETLLVVDVTGARNDAQAKRVAKVIVNSPLVKTAVAGADPNWGRVVMAIGKLSDETDIDPDRVTVHFGDQELYPAEASEADLAALSDYMAGDEVRIGADLGIGGGAWTVYGCDLTAGYVRINADYTT